MIDESNFEYLQSAIVDICCLKTGPMDQQAFNPANAKAKEIAAAKSLDTEKDATITSRTGTTEEAYLEDTMEDLDIPIFLRRRDKNK